MEPAFSANFRPEARVPSLLRVATTRILVPAAHYDPQSPRNVIPFPDGARSVRRVLIAWVAVLGVVLRGSALACLVASIDGAASEIRSLTEMITIWAVLVAACFVRRPEAAAAILTALAALGLGWVGWPSGSVITDANNRALGVTGLMLLAAAHALHGLWASERAFSAPRLRRNAIWALGLAASGLATTGSLLLTDGLDTGMRLAGAPEALDPTQPAVRGDEAGLLLVVGALALATFWLAGIRRFRDLALGGEPRRCLVTELLLVLASWGFVINAFTSTWALPMTVGLLGALAGAAVWAATFVLAPGAGDEGWQIPLLVLGVVAAIFMAALATRSLPAGAPLFFVSLGVAVAICLRIWRIVSDGLRSLDSVDDAALNPR